MHLGTGGAHYHSLGMGFQFSSIQLNHNTGVMTTPLTPLCKPLQWSQMVLPECMARFNFEALNSFHT